MSTHTTIEKDLNGRTVADKAQEVAVETQQKVSEATSIAKEQAKRAAAQVSDQAKTTVDTRMSDVAQEVGSVAEAVRQTTYEIGGESETIARYGERIADQLETVSSYLNEKGVEDVLTDIQDFARRQPAVFLGGAFMLGMVVGRFMRSSSANVSNLHYRENIDAGYTSNTSSSAYGHNAYQGQNRYQSGLSQESTTFQDRD